MCRKDKILNAFPPNLTEDVRKVIGMLSIKDGDISNRCYEVNLEGTMVAVPERIYISDRKPHSDMTSDEKMIMDCIFTRHYDGFVRQRHLQNLISCTEYWVVPFCFRLLGEYVYEILHDVRKHIDSNIDNYLRFVGENKNFFDKTKNQMFSYWDCYYKTKFPQIESYIGFDIFNYLDVAYNKQMNLPKGRLSARHYQQKRKK